MNLFDDKGNPVPVANGEQASAALLAGRVFTRRDKPVAVVNPENKVVEIAGTDAHAAIASGSYRIASDQEVRREQLEQKLGKPGSAMGLLNMYAADVLGVSRGATGPGVDLLTTEVASLFGKKEEAKQYIRDLKEAYPAQSGVAEMKGLLGSVLLGGEGVAAKGAAQAPRLATAARGAAAAVEAVEGARALGAGERAVALLGRGEAAAARTARTAAVADSLPFAATEVAPSAGRVTRPLVTQAPAVAEEVSAAAQLPLNTRPMRAAELGAGPSPRLLGAPNVAMEARVADLGVPAVDGILETPRPVRALPAPPVTGEVVAYPGALGEASAARRLGAAEAEILESGLPTAREGRGRVYPDIPTRREGGGFVGQAPEPAASPQEPNWRPWQEPAPPPGPAAPGVTPGGNEGPGQAGGFYAPPGATGGPVPSPGIDPVMTARALIPSSAVDLLGGAVERGVRHYLPGLPGKLAGHMARGATEMALFEAGAQLDEQVLGDADVNGEKVLAAMGHGALLGAALGGVLGTGAEGLSSIAKSVAPKLRGLPERMVIDALSPTNKMRAKMADLGGESALGRMLLDEFVAKNPGLGKTADLAPALRAELEAMAEKVAIPYLKADRGNWRGPTMEAVLKEVERGLKGIRDEAGNVKWPSLSRLGEMPNTYSSRTLEGFLADMQSKGPTSFNDWWHWQKEADRLAKFEAASASPTAEAFRDIRSIIQEQIMAAGDAEAKRLSVGPLSDEIKAANMRFRQLDWLTKAAERFATTEASKGMNFFERFVIPFAFWHAGPVGLAKGWAVSLAASQARQRAASMAGLVDRMTSIGSLKKLTMNVDEAIDASVADFFRNSKPRRIKYRVYDLPDEGGSTKQKFDRRVEMLDRVQAGGVQLGVERAFAGMPTIAPQTHAATVASAGRALQFLQMSRPQAQTTPLGVARQVTEADMREFNRRWEAVEDPIGVLTRSLSTGNVSPGQVEAIKASYPKLMDAYRAKAIAQVAETHAEGKRVPKQKAIQLSILFDVQLDDTIGLVPLLQKQAANDVQAPKKRGGGSGPSFGSVKVPSFADAFATDAERRMKQRR